MSWISRNCSGGAVALDPHGVLDRLVAGHHVVGDAEEAAQVELAGGLDLDLVQPDPAHRRAGDVADHDAGVERRHQHLLRVGGGVLAQQLERLVDRHHEPALHLLAADHEGLDRRLAAGLPPPAGSDPEPHHALGRVVADILDHLGQGIHVEAVDPSGLGGHRCRCRHRIHRSVPFLSNVFAGLPWVRPFDQQNAGAIASKRWPAPGRIASTVSRNLSWVMPEPR